MTIRYLSSLLLIIFSSNFISQIMELGFSIENGYTFVKEVDSKLPLIISYDDNFDDVEFWNTEFKTTNQTGGSLFMQARFTDMGIIIGTGINIKRYNNNYRGYTDYTQGFYDLKYGDFDSYNNSQGGNATQQEFDDFITTKHTSHQKPFEINQDILLFSNSLYFGYKFNTYKTWRPYIIFNPSILTQSSTTINSTNINHEGYKFSPDLEFELTLDSRFQFGLTLGVEWRDVKFFTTLSTVSEKLTFGSDKYANPGEEYSLPYKNRRFISLGLAYRFVSGQEKTIEPYTHATAKDIAINKRTPRFGFFSLGLGATVLSFMDSRSEIGDYITMLETNTKKEQINTATVKETINIKIASIGPSNAEAKTLAFFNAGLTLVTKFIDFELLGSYSALKTEFEYDLRTAEIYRYVVNGNPFDYYFSENEYDFDLFLRYDFNNYQIAYNAKIKLGELIGIKDGPAYFLIGIRKGYYTTKKTLNSDKNINNFSFSKDLYDIYSGNPIESENNYITFTDEWSYYGESTIIATAENPSERFQTMESFQTLRGSEILKSTGWDFGFGYRFGKIDARFGYHTTNNWQKTSIIKSLEGMYLSINYAIKGK